MRVWNVLILSSLFGLASLFATPPASSPVAMPAGEAQASPGKEKPAELKGKVTFSYELRWSSDGANTVRVEIQPDGEVVTIRNGNEARFRLGPAAIASLAADLEKTPVYIAPECDLGASFGRSEEMTILYPDARILARRGIKSRDVPERVERIQAWLGDIERNR